MVRAQHGYRCRDRLGKRAACLLEDVLETGIAAPCPLVQQGHLRLGRLLRRRWRQVEKGAGVAVERIVGEMGLDAAALAAAALRTVRSPA